MQPSTETRKQDHINIVLNQDVQAKGVTSGFERFFFEHVALPEIDLDAIDLSVTLWNRSLQAPLLISSMTGGTAAARAINLNLAEAAQALGIAMGVGSQRAAIERRDLESTYQVRHVAPNILLLANLGAVQLNYGYGLDQARRAVEMCEADALILHLNPLQEAVQPHGDGNWSDLYRKIEQLANRLAVPIIAKEVGNGISGSVARRLAEVGVAAIDVAGAGGTSWSEVEAHRQRDPLRQQVAHAFAGWGIPTALALMEVGQAVPELPMIASGGIRSGIEVAMAIRLGATLVGSAAPVLGPAAQDRGEAVYDKYATLIEALRIAAFCTGSQDLAALRSAKLRWQHSWALVS